MELDSDFDKIEQKLMDIVDICKTAKESNMVPHRDLYLSLETDAIEMLKEIYGKKLW
jgi:hypothetical protein